MQTIHHPFWCSFWPSQAEPRQVGLNLRAKPLGYCLVLPLFFTRRNQYAVVPLNLAIKALRQARPIPRLHKERARRQPQGFLQVDKLTNRNLLQIRPAQDKVQIAAAVAVTADAAALSPYFDTGYVFAQDLFQHAVMSRFQMQPFSHPDPLQ